MDMDHSGHHRHHHHHQMVTTKSSEAIIATSSSSMSMMDHSSHMGHSSVTFQLWTTSKLLIEQWPLDTLQGLVTGMLFAVILSIVYEGSKFYYHLGKILYPKTTNCRWHGTRVAHYISRLWKSVAYMLHFLIGYLLMLCTMTYNLWMLVSVCLGAGLGYFFLLPLIMHFLNRHTDNEACAARDHVTSLCRQVSRQDSHEKDCDVAILLNGDNEACAARDHVTSLCRQVSWEDSHENDCDVEILLNGDYESLRETVL